LPNLEVNCLLQRQNSNRSPVHKIILDAIQNFIYLLISPFKLLFRLLSFADVSRNSPVTKKFSALVKEWDTACFYEDQLPRLS
jgi:hypothetical protein